MFMFTRDSAFPAEYKVGPVSVPSIYVKIALVVGPLALLAALARFF